MKNNTLRTIRTMIHVWDNDNYGVITVKKLVDKGVIMNNHEKLRRKAGDKFAKAFIANKIKACFEK